MALSDWWSSVNRLGTEVKTQLHPIRSRILNDPYYRLQSVDEVRLAAELGMHLDVNQSSVDDWLRLPGISIHQARSLVALSQSGVSFHCLDDLAAALSVPIQRLKPLEPLLRFCYYDADSVCAVQPINPNTASVELLTRIPAIDLFLARAIVQHRQTNGKYRNLADLQQRLALPGGLTAEIMHYLCF
ncbi:ComEA family DNA-binding protein [Oculatella sp. LEGE 06141]|uniref:helix-hairpin-helix domain-containing protein n=1 Tax=Oculatella sp. LEGE 06141 TaxID=1828648 RepID=UPI001880E5E3|nr:ComEA family DNA-binding protein [Oculatella sp. LEGE 06141]MBE9177980.1 ComEA family DNA-binding protein [Oculatella sp. LEGE 06141]